MADIAIKIVANKLKLACNMSRFCKYYVGVLEEFNYYEIRECTTMLT